MQLAGIMIISGFVLAFGGFLTMAIGLMKKDNRSVFLSGMAIMAFGGFLTSGGFLLGGWRIIQQFFSIIQ